MKISDLHVVDESQFTQDIAISIAQKYNTLNKLLLEFDDRVKAIGFEKTAAYCARILKQTHDVDFYVKLSLSDPKLKKAYDQLEVARKKLAARISVGI